MTCVDLILTKDPYFQQSNVFENGSQVGMFCKKKNIKEKKLKQLRKKISENLNFWLG